MIYQMLAGELPFRTNNPGALLMSYLNQPPPDIRKLLPELPRQVAKRLQKAMAKIPEECFNLSEQMFQSLI